MWKALSAVALLVIVPAISGAVSPDRIDGSDPNAIINGSEWRQAYFEIQRMTGAGVALPALSSVLDAGRADARSGIIPLAVLDSPVRPAIDESADADPFTIQDGRLELAGNLIEEERPVFTATAIRGRTYHGAETRFVLDRELYFAVGRDDRDLPDRIDVDFGDGHGYRALRFGHVATVRYDAPGRKTIRLRAHTPAGETRFASFPFDVLTLRAPLPHDTLAITATEPYLGVAGTGDAFVYLADGHTSITNPVVVVEGFDLDNTMNWDELYDLLNQQNLVETLRAEGFDAVVLNFTEATDYMQRNAFVVAELVAQVGAMIDSGATFPMIGASMGGLCSRFALTWMENEGIDHGVRSYISFDSPHKGANIPLGIQYWVYFFADLSADAEYLLGRLNTPAARQMLVYHHTDPAGSTGEADSLRPAFDAELAAIGDWPAAPRKVSVANGSGSATGQGFAPGEQIVDYEYNGLLIDITGNVWAVPDGGPSMIFDGYMRIWPLSASDLEVTVSGTEPYDNAPGGWRATMLDMDSTEAPYGDIIALHPAHAFIPTISALALDTSDLFHDIAGDPNLLAITPFDTVYFPAENQEHVLITPESAEWFLSEIRDISTGVDVAGAEAPAPIVLLPNRPNPFNPETSIRFVIGEAGPVSVRLFDAAGRQVAILLDEPRAAGAHEVRFRAGSLPSGVYFYRVAAGGAERTGKMTLIR